ncbi:hypothetical protein [Neisseria iguanae]|nr:hypothetical protein [Neisseria iguanae]
MLFLKSQGYKVEMAEVAATPFRTALPERLPICIICLRVLQCGALNRTQT